MFSNHYLILSCVATRRWPRYVVTLIVLGLICLVTANPAQAVQAHGGVEGLVSHQLGHLLFTIGMVVLLLQIHGNTFRKSGWKLFQVFLCLIICWNVLTFAGHWLSEYVDPTKYITSAGRRVGFRIDGFADAVFYLSRLDHLLLLPAFIFLLAALRKWITASSEAS